MGLLSMTEFGGSAKERAKELLAEGRTPIYLLFDLLNFQTFNDRFGYDRGNELLAEMGGILQKNFPGDPCARESSDFFVVLTDAGDFEERAGSVEDDLTAAFEDEIYLGIRLGAYRVQKPDTDPLHAIDRARYALGLRRNKGRALVALYDEECSKEYHTRQYVLNNLDKAIANGYIKAYYQPVIWGEDEMLCGCEALARWDDPEVGFLSPGQFIPILEESRQIHRLDRCVYESVCRNLRDCMDRGLPVLETSLNFSQLDFNLMDAVGELEALVEKYQIPKHLLHVEITESILTEDRENLKQNMKRLHDSGYAIWLDDFGSGYSSMNVLKDFDFDLMKLDMEFLRNFSGNVKAYKIIRRILDLARDLGMQTLAEGVETREAVDFLRGAGCGRLQGYYYGRPMPYEELLGKIEDGTFRLRQQ